jgi:DNA-directed RNA polymerase beta subunit
LQRMPPGKESLGRSALPLAEPVIDRFKRATMATRSFMPNLIEVQKASYDQFLMVDEPLGGRNDDEGLQAVFKSVFPISDFSGTRCWSSCPTSSNRRSTTLRSAASAT